MKLYVPIYKTEAGVHTQNPSIAEFNTLATVLGAQVGKPAVEVLLVWNAGTSQWDEVDTYTVGMKTATKTFNPLDSTTAYLYMPIGDYLAVFSCCSMGGGYLAPGSGGGITGGGSGRILWDSGTILAAEDQNTEVLTVELDDMDALAPFAVYVSSGLQIEWGDGNVRSYPEGVLVIRTFAGGYDGLVKIYHTGIIQNLTLMDDAGAFRGTITSITGALPAGLETVQIANNLPPLGMPGFDYTLTKVVNLSSTALTVVKLNTVLDALIAAGLLGGHLSILTNPRQDADLTKINTLKSRGWTVQAYGVYPNL